MARNEEKAQSLLNRWTSMKQDFANTFKNRRPYTASLCHTLRDAEKFRRQIVREISRKISDIQNAGSSEHIIRDLNDEINRKIRLKRHWELRIIELGGPDYGKSQPQVYESDDDVVHAGGYKYFGAAKDLPGVRELFEKPKETNEKKRSVDELYANISPDYYGFRDDDAELLEEEKLVEKAQLQVAIEEWEAQHSGRMQGNRASVLCAQ
uniref:PremRNAsplicing factor ISY1 putative n=1 Tax=Albugo laibachii Nc14 TaxID=890382 RepID=F0W807_9STRA|nr:premRNAsplicing factor ISY1 putative [Albugo laibachii Nc14]|eukprot:CCA17260.1 premRNAsplicing factor ISY1 putative [Albugo laibachii Nc14]